MLKRSYHGFFENLNVQISRTRWYRILKSITRISPSCISPSPPALSFENQPTVGIGKSKLNKNVERGQLESWSERCTATDTRKYIDMRTCLRLITSMVYVLIYMYPPPPPTLSKKQCEFLFHATRVISGSTHTCRQQLSSSWSVYVICLVIINCMTCFYSCDNNNHWLWLSFTNTIFQW